MPTSIEPAIALTSSGPVEYLLRDHAAGNDTPVILAIHGAMGGYDQSDILGRAIGPSGFRYIGISRPGYLGTPLKGNASPEAQADLAAALLDSLQIDKTIIFAISGGGYCALHFALRHRHRCRALVLCSTTGSKTDTPIPFSFHMVRLLARLPLLPDLMRRRIDRNIEGSLKRSVTHADLFDQMIKDRETMALFRELSVGAMTDITKRLPGTANDIRNTRSRDYPLADIRVPTLVIHGTEDPHVPFNAHGRRLASNIPGAVLHAVERGEHAAIFTHRNEVRQAVAGFFNNIL